MANPKSITSTQKTTVRVALAVGATVATMLGAQMLALGGLNTTAQNAQAGVQANTGLTYNGNFYQDDSGSNGPSYYNDGQVTVSGNSQTFNSVSPAVLQPRPRSRSSR